MIYPKPSNRLSRQEVSTAHSPGAVAAFLKEHRSIEPQPSTVTRASVVMVAWFARKGQGSLQTQFRSSNLVAEHIIIRKHVTLFGELFWSVMVWFDHFSIDWSVETDDSFDLSIDFFSDLPAIQPWWLSWGLGHQKAHMVSILNMFCWWGALWLPDYYYYYYSIYCIHDSMLKHEQFDIFVLVCTTNTLITPCQTIKIVLPSCKKGRGPHFACYKVTICDYPLDSLLPRLASFVHGLYAQHHGDATSTLCHYVLLDLLRVCR